MNHPHLKLISQVENRTTPISFSEMLEDHCAILEGYLDTHVTRNHSSTTLKGEQTFLTSWFEGILVADENHPSKERQLLVWEAMRPVIGRERIKEFSKGLVLTGLSPRTVNSYLGSLRRLFDYILEFPYIPGQAVQFIVPKYGSKEQPVSKYDYPVHAIDQEDEGFVLVGKQLYEFYNFVRTTYIEAKQKKLTVSRDYAMIILAGESGLRADEICQLDALGLHRDLFYEFNLIQTRYGKGVNGSGKRVRKTIFTERAQDVIRIYEDQIRPNFRNAKTNVALFLTERGDRMNYQCMWAFLESIVESARKEGFQLPPKMSWHSLRKSFATNYMEQCPGKVWELMKLMGHQNLSTLHRYVIPGKETFEQAQNNLVIEMMPDREISGE
jgi:site-specific recombinase XerD